MCLCLLIFANALTQSWLPLHGKEVQLEPKTIATVSLLVDISLRVILKFVLDKPRLFATIFLFHQVILDRNFVLIMTFFVGHTAYLPPVMLQKVSQSVMDINAVLRCHRDSRDHFKMIGLNHLAKTNKTNIRVTVSPFCCFQW